MHGILGPDDMLPGGETRVEIAFRMIRSRFPVVTQKTAQLLKADLAIVVQCQSVLLP